jgi:hypothetical protein
MVDLYNFIPIFRHDLNSTCEYDCHTYTMLMWQYQEILGLIIIKKERKK